MFGASLDSHSCFGNDEVQSIRMHWARDYLRKCKCLLIPTAFITLYFMYMNGNMLIAESPSVVCDIQSAMKKEYQFYSLPILGIDSLTHNLSTPTLSTSYSPRNYSDLCEQCLSFVLLYTKSGQETLVQTLLDHLLIPYKRKPSEKISELKNEVHEVSTNGGRFAVRLIILEDLSFYLSLSLETRLNLDKFCAENSIAVIAFLNNGENVYGSTGEITKLGHLPLYLHHLASTPWGFYLPKTSNVFRIVRSGRLQPGYLNAYLPTDTVPNHQEYRKAATIIPSDGNDEKFEVLGFTQLQGVSNHNEQSNTQINKMQWKNCTIQSNANPRELNGATYQSLVLLDHGLHDGVKRILFASSSDGFWANSILLLDSIMFLSAGTIHASSPSIVSFSPEVQKKIKQLTPKQYHANLDLIRWILLDIDDVFLGSNQYCFTPMDVRALIEAQNRWRKIIPNFTFNLGFNGYGYETANEAKIPGFDALLKNRHLFWWFNHFWKHERADELTQVELTQLIRRNHEFALEHDIPIKFRYTVSPYHAGIYPVHRPLYDAWRTESKLEATSTLEYPPYAAPRMGFNIHGIKVLPRQTCTIWSRHNKIDQYVGGIDSIRRIALGGEVFQTILLTPISIFMTHLPNYQEDRLAIYMFDTLFNFISNWTNLQLITSAPTELSNIYSDRFKAYGANDPPIDTCPARAYKLLRPEYWSCILRQLYNFW